MTWRVAFLTALTLCAAAAPSERFFPARPSGAVLSMQEGVLVQYRVEDLAGTVTLRISLDFSNMGSASGLRI